VTAGAIAGAQEIATQFWQKAEAERQKAREEEAEAALRHCQEEGGCGADGGASEIDPGKCVAVGGLNENFEWEGHRTDSYANFKCKGKATGVVIELCVVDEGLVASSSLSRADGAWEECVPKELSSLSKAEWAILLPEFQCAVGAWYALWVWYWEPGMVKGAVGWGKEEQCDTDGLENFSKGVQEGAEGPLGPRS
jgi:hypothetical protein